jgi:hypothetical protein
LEEVERYGRVRADRDGLAAETPDNKTIWIDAIHLKAHHTRSNLGSKKGGVGV